MKQKILLTIIFLGSAATLFAQPATMNSSATHFPYAAQQQAHIAAKNTASIGERPIAAANYDNNGVSFYLSDSGTFSFSGTRDRSVNTIIAITGGRVQFKFDTSYDYTYDTTTGLYSNNYRYSQTFDLNNNATGILYQYWISGNWTNGNQDLFTYDAMNNILTHINQNWSGSSWTNESQDLFTYDGMSNILSDINQTWDPGSSAWVNSSQYLLTYDGMNNMLTSINQNWNSTTSTWENNTKQTNTYDAMNNLSTETEQLWNTTTGVWDNSSYFTYTYDAMNDLTSVLQQHWNSIVSTWVNSTDNLYSSFVGGQAQLQTSQNWDTITSAFVNRQEFIYTYDSYIQPVYTYSQTWDTTSASWQGTVNDYASRFYYQEYTTAIQNMGNTSGKTLAVYPNPNNGQFTIESSVISRKSSLAVYNVLGELVYNTTLNQDKSHTVDVGTQSAGVYFYSVISENGALIGDGKLTIQK